MKRTLIIILLIIATCKFAISQTPQDIQKPNDPMEAITALVEETASSNDEEDADVDFEQIYDYFANLLINPININTATRADLERMYILSDFQIASLIDYIAKNGQLFSIYELSVITGFDDDLAEKLYPFITADATLQTRNDTAKLKDMVSRGKHQIVARGRQLLEKQAGFKNDASNKFAGSPQAILARYTYSFGDRLKWNFTTEKDPGEKFMDFYSASLQYESRKGILRKIVVGDFQAQFGQGLVIWNGFGLGRSTSNISARKRARGVYAYSSTDENRYMRGAATTLALGKINISLFASYKKRDASIADSAGQIFSSLQTTGLHRTNSEIENKNSVSEMIFGANASYEYKNFKIGATGLWHKFGADYVRDVQPYNMFELNKSHNSNYSADAQWSWRRLILFAETAFDANNKNATVAGASFNLEQGVQFSVAYRNYSRKYQALYSRGFGDGTKTSNEEGFYASVSFAPIKKVQIAAYFDIFKFPWLKYRINAPSDGWTYAINVNYSMRKHIKMSLNVKQKNGNENYTPAGANMAATGNKRSFHAKYNITYPLFGALQMQSRIEYSRFDKTDSDRENGFVFLQDISYSFKKLPLDISARYAYFHTNGWNSRIYAYESDVLYAFSVPAYYSIGSRWYCNARYKISKNIDLYFRLAQTIYNDKDYTGSGVTKIDGNKQTEIKVQIKIKL